MDPFIENMIGIAAVVFACALGVIIWRIVSNPTLKAAFFGAPAESTAESTAESYVSKFGFISKFFSTLFKYSPTALFSYGFIHSVIFQSYEALIPNMFALVGLVLNRLLDGFFPPSPIETPPTRTMDTSFCDIPGLMWFSDIAALPPSVILVTTILWHYLLIEWLGGYNFTKTIIPTVSLLVLLIGHSAVIINNCVGSGWTLTRTALAVLVGLALGSASMATLKYGLASSTPSSNQPSNTLLNSSSNASKGLGSSSGSGVGTCSAPNDQDQFVCEAYKNGELITTTIVE
jgi:hypothetical protein